MNKWDERFIDMAKLISTWSKDPNKKVGAVVIDHQRRIVGAGYNGFPRGVNDVVERYMEQMVKYKMVVHAETNAILNANKSVLECTLYSTKFPCTECTKIIIQSGIGRIVAPTPPSDSSWVQDAAFSRVMLSEAAISILEF